MIFQINRRLFHFKNKLIFQILILSLVLIGNSVLAQSNTINAGIVSGLWYSKASFFVGDQIRIYTAIQNQSGFDFTGTIQFFDGETIIGESEFSVVHGGFIKEWADWEVTQGHHSISVQIINAQKHELNKDPGPIFLDLGVFGSDEQFADFDTDGDLIGNEEDLDDDNDNINDEGEMIIGTNPLVADTDNDGIDDGKEIEQGTDPLVPEEIDTQEASETVQRVEKILNFTKEEAGKILQWTIERIENKQAIVKKDIEEEVEPKPIFGKSLASLGSIFGFLGMSKEKIPTWEHVYGWFLGIVLFILKKPWLLLVIVLFVIKIFWKLKK